MQENQRRRAVALLSRVNSRLLRYDIDVPDRLLVGLRAVHGSFRSRYSDIKLRYGIRSE